MKNRNDLLTGIADFHSHILPCADHGSDSIETTIAQIGYATRNGVKKIVATPHFYPHRHLIDKFLDTIMVSYSKLLPRISEYNVEICLGAEILLCDGICNIPRLSELCINGSNTLLVEFPFVHLEKRHYKMVEGLVESGYDVVIAHAERYDKDFINSLLPLDLSLQLNASSICKIGAMRRFKEWFSEGKVSAIGSDIHGKNSKAYKYFSKAVALIAPYAENLISKTNLIWNKKTNS